MLQSFLHRSSRLCLLLVIGCGLPQADRKALAAACEGQAVPGAGAYEGTPAGFVPFSRDSSDAAFGYHAGGVDYRLERPKTLAETRTVFCMEPVQEVIEGQCVFETSEGIGIAGVQVVETERSEGPTFDRVAMQRTGRIVDPATGKTVAEHTVKAEAPDCKVFTGDPVAANFRALPPSGISFGDWAAAQLGVDE